MIATLVLLFSTNGVARPFPAVAQPSRARSCEGSPQEAQEELEQ